MGEPNKRNPMKRIYRDDRRTHQMDAWFFGGVAVIAVLFIMAMVIGR